MTPELLQTASLQESLENTLLINTVKLFSVLAKSDEQVTETELQYVRNYLHTIYHDPVASYLFSQFERFVREDIDEKQAASQIRNGFSYENRVFILMKVYELAASDSVEDAERETARHIGKLIGVNIEDIGFIESIYDLNNGVALETSKPTAIQSLRISDKATFADIVLPYSGLDIEVYKVNSIYIVLPKNNKNAVFVGDTQLAGDGIPDLLNATKIQHNESIIISQYTINFEDLNYYFQLKSKLLLGFALFVSRRSEAESLQSTEYVLSHFPGVDDVLLIEFTKLFILITPLNSDESRLIVNGKIIDSQVYVNLNDAVQIDNCPINLRKLAFQYGLESEVFKLELHKERYFIGNHPESDIYLHDEMVTFWKCSLIRHAQPDGGFYFTLDPKSCPYRISYESKTVKHPILLADECNVIIGKNVLQLSFLAGTCRIEPFRFKDFIARQIRYRFQDNSLALDDISFEIDYGDLVCVIGPSGSGKSTLLNIINGYNKPNDGCIELNSFNLHREYGALKDYLGYVPQDDLLFENLTVYENLYYNAKLRHPDKTETEIQALVEQTIIDIDLVEKRDVRAGSPTQRTLSGGQRKRLNIGLELLADADVYFLDEPTSGLSSKDSEKIIELLQRLTLKGKIIFVVIHQPSSKIYRMFDKILFLDKGGKLAFFGDVMAALAYFRNHAKFQYIDPIERNLTQEAAELAQENIEPDILLATLEEPLRDIDGIPLPKRKYSPEYWKERYLKFRSSVHRLTIEESQKIALPPPRELSWKEKWGQFAILLQRNFINKLRDRSNLLITFLEAPVLALAVSIILRHTGVKDVGYTLYQNDNITIFIFLAVIITTFLAITNSIDEIIKDAAILLRERMLNIRNTSYYASKFITLTMFSLVQNALFLLAAFPVLQLRELFWMYWLFLAVVSLNGIALGLLVSAIPNLSSKAAFNIVPLILIPQIIFGGALIPYSEMDHLKINHHAEVPEICQLIPSRWAFEGLMAMQDGFNSYQPVDDSLQAASKRILALTEKRDGAIVTHDEILADSVYHPVDTQKIQLLQEQITNADREIQKFEQQRPILDSMIEVHRTVYQDKYGNQEIHRQISEARDKFEEAKTQYQERMVKAGIKYAGEVSWVYYPILLPQKQVPFTQHWVSTLYYNTILLLLMTIFANIAALLLLSFRENILDFFHNRAVDIGNLFGKLIGKRRGKAKQR